MGIADLMDRVDARIDASRIGDVLIVGTAEINGHFFRQPREIVLRDGGVMAIGISFECQYASAIGLLSEGDPVEVSGHGEFRFLRELLPGGDESGLTIVELGSVL